MFKSAPLKSINKRSKLYSPNISPTPLFELHQQFRGTLWIKSGRANNFAVNKNKSHDLRLQKQEMMVYFDILNISSVFVKTGY